MRQVLISTNPNIKELSGDKVTLLSNILSFDRVKGNGVTLVRFPLEISVLTGGDVNVKFELAKELAKKGIILLGAYYEGKEVEAALMSVVGKDVEIGDKTPVLTGTLLETVRYRQIDSKIMGDLVVVGSRGSKALEIKGKGKKKGKKSE